MKISRRNLNKLIESYVFEQHSLLPAAINLSKILKDLLMFDRAKREANIKDADKYFHALAFYSVTVKYKLTSEELTKIFGGGKELIDALNPFGATPLLKIDIKGDPKISFSWNRMSSEWKDDMESNLFGASLGLKVNNGEISKEEANKVLYERLVHTLSDLKSSSKKPEYYDDVYGWAKEKYPSLYADNKKWIQPRYNIFLSPSERAEAWEKQKSKPSWISKLIEPLNIA